jgi:ABC-type multidrug transport system ATPase subunit
MPIIGTDKTEEIYHSRLTGRYVSAENAIVVKGLRKSFKQLTVLDDVNFVIKKGTVLALLGPNGAGKTTTIRILSTLLLPDSGQALINGFDVVKEADKVRSLIGLTGQYAALDEYLTGKENLYMIDRLYRLSHSDINRRSQELLSCLTCGSVWSLSKDLFRWHVPSARSILSCSFLAGTITLTN